jgi:hypothetical protein
MATFRDLRLARARSEVVVEQLVQLIGASLVDCRIGFKFGHGIGP